MADVSNELVSVEQALQAGVYVAGVCSVWKPATHTQSLHYQCKITHFHFDKESFGPRAPRVLTRSGPQSEFYFPLFFHRSNVSLHYCKKVKTRTHN